MKKLILGSLVLITYSFACLCTPDIVPSFERVSTKIANTLNRARNEIIINTIPQIKKNIEDIKKQNEIIRKIIVAYGKENVQKDELIFLYEKLKKIEE